VHRANVAVRMRRVRQATAADAAASPAANPSAAASAWSEENRHALARGIVEHMVHRAGTAAVARLLGEPPQMRTGRVTLGAPGEDGCFAVVYDASGVAAEERGTLPAHDVFRYAVELPPPPLGQQSGNGSRSAWWQGVRQRVPLSSILPVTLMLASPPSTSLLRCDFSMALLSLLYIHTYIHTYILSLSLSP
jgi:hypothetical protein